MTKDTYNLIENYMLSCMEDSAHDKEHIYRVLYGALEIARAETDVDYDVLIAACLLHDVGRREQFENPSICHAMVGAEKAYSFLLGNGFGESFAGKVKHCIQTHRFRKSMEPESTEAKILFDADKLDVTGALGIARTFCMKGMWGIRFTTCCLMEASVMAAARNRLLSSGSISLNWKSYMTTFIPSEAQNLPGSGA